MLDHDPDSFGEYGVPAHVIQKTQSEQIRVGINEHKGFEYIDVRSFFLSADGWRPTRKGVTLPPRLYPELLRAILELGGQLGIIGPEVLDSFGREDEPGDGDAPPSVNGTR